MEYIRLTNLKYLFMYRFLISYLFILMSLPVCAQDLFTIDKETKIGKMVTTSVTDLCDVADGTLSYLNKGAAYDPDVIKAGVVSRFGIDLARVKRTLAFVCQVEREDSLAKRASRLSDPDFIRRHFQMIQWRPDKHQAQAYSLNKPLLKNIPDNKILVTKYYIKLAQGNAEQTINHPHPLYALPFDEQGMSLDQADQHKNTLIRYQLTKQQVLTGILDKKSLAQPLVWLTRDDLEDTLMQGTAKVTIGSRSVFFNVHRNNDIGYQRNVKKRDQQRYWYFKQTSSILGYGKDADYKIPIHPMVAVAGDLKYLGLGKLILLTANGESRLTILSDTGGAFENNQYQLDYLGGFFKDWDDYINTYRHFPDYFEARILIVKE